MENRVMVTRQGGSGRAKKLTEVQIDKAVEMYNAGVTQKDVAKHFGVTPATMRKYLKERTPQHATRTGE